MDPFSIIEQAKKERVVYRYRYRQNPVCFADLLRKRYPNKRIALYPKTAHSLKVADILGSVNVMVLDIDDIDMDLFDYVALVGYWDKAGIDSFVKKLSIEPEKIIAPYKILSKRCFFADIDKQLESLCFPKDKHKPEMVVIVGHEGKDYCTFSSKELDRYFRLTKISLSTIDDMPQNSYFAQFLSLNGDIKGLEIFFKKYRNEIDMCAVFTHGMDFWKIPYVKTMLAKHTKLITMTCDWLSSMEDDLELVSTATNKPISYVDMERRAEVFAKCYSDGIVTNYGGDILKKISNTNSNTLSSYAFFGADNFVFKNKERHAYKCCFAGSLMSGGFSNAFALNQRLAPIFDKLAKSGFEIDVYGAYGVDLSKSEYAYLLSSNSLRQKQTVKNSDLPEILSEYDFGLILYNFEGTADIVSFFSRDIYQAKFMTYMAAGIPIVVSADFHEMSKIVKKFRCGIVVSSKELDDIKNIFNYVDYVALKKGVKNFQRYYKEANPPSVLADFLKKVLVA